MNNAKILYVDDEPLNIMLFEVHFSQYFNVVSTNSGITGLEILNN